MTVSDAAAAVQKVLSCVSDLRSNQQWSRIWQRCLESAETQIPQTATKKLIDTGSDPVISVTPEVYYRRVFYELLDVAHNELKYD